MAAAYGAVLGDGGAGRGADDRRPDGADERTSILSAAANGSRPPAEPEVRLETLSAFATKCVLVLTYTAFGVAVLAGTVSWATTPNAVVPPLAPCPDGGLNVTSGCTTAFADDEIVVWRGVIADVPQWSPLFELDVSFTGDVAWFIESRAGEAGPSDDGLYLLTLTYDATVTVGDEGARLLHAKNASTQSLCTHHACEDARLLSPYRSAGGLGAGGGYSRYEFELVFRGVDAALLAAAADVEYRFYYERPSFFVVDVGLRCALLATTVIALAYWAFKCHQHRPRLADWLDERVWVLCFFLCLLLFQNPVFTVAQFYASVGAATHVASAGCEAVAQAGFLTLWLVYMDGLRSASHPWPGFYAKKLVFGALVLAVSAGIIVLDAVSPAPALSAQWQGEPGSPLYRTYVVCGGLLAALNFVWFCWFVVLMVRTGRALGGRHYMRTRYQQLPYRFFVFQAILALLYVVCYYLLQAYQFFVLPLVQKHVGFLAACRLSWEAASSAALADWAQSSYVPISKSLFVSVSTYLLAFIYLPPWRKPKAGAVSNFHVQWEHELLLVDRRRIDRRRIRLMPSHPAKAGADEGQVFCLETACMLLDVAWEAYNYIPGTGGSVSGAGYAGVDVERLGFRVVAFLQREQSDVHALVVRGHGRIVISFRGTASAQSWLTDLKVAHEVLRVDLDGPKFVVRRADEAARRRGGGGGGGGSRAAGGGMHMGGHAHAHAAGGGAAGATGVPPTNPLARALRGVRGATTRVVGSVQYVTSGVADRLKHVVGHIPGAQLVLPRVHSGFWGAYGAVRQELHDVVRAALEQDYAPIYVTGHSMGGALATLCAYDLSSNMDLPNEVIMYNFGSPRCGNLTFVRSYNERVPCSFRCVVDGDIVTGVPSLVGMYRHVGTEVVFDGAGNLLVDPSFVETVFGTKTRRSVASHSMYQYRDGLHACFAASSQVKGQDLVDEFDRWHSEDVW